MIGEIEVGTENVSVAVIGASFGGVIAAISAAKTGNKVILTEETDWVGGQVTSQGVPPDEHKWIEQTGCTATYRQFRNRVRAYYKENYPLTDEAAKDVALNPGKAWVSHISHEPKVALKVLQDMMAPYINSGKIKCLYHLKPIKVHKVDKKIQFVTLENVKTHEIAQVKADYFLDATETGELLPLAEIPYVLGAESKDQTGEKHAPEVADFTDTQAITYVMALDYVENGSFIIKKPEQYDFWKNHIPKNHGNALLNWFVGNENDPTPYKEFTLFPNDKEIADLFTYRRVLDKSILSEEIYEGDITLVNWPQNDFFLGSIIDVPEDVREERLTQAKQLSLSLLYWLQKEAPRLDGGKGFPGLRLRLDVFDTEDGLAKYPYIRESRRIIAVDTITEDRVSRETAKGIHEYENSVGVGNYHLDLHTTASTMTALYVPSYPYELPLGAFISSAVSNLLPACKNIGTTHITNGCYRLHPTEWNIGEVAGYLAAYALKESLTPMAIYESNVHTKAFQSFIEAQGVQIHWPTYVHEEVISE